MSVRTTADEKLEDTKKSIKTSIENLSEIIIQRCDGYIDYQSQYVEKMKKSLFELIEIRERLGD